MSTPAVVVISTSQFSQAIDDSIRIIETYFKNFESLTKSEEWNEILISGTAALEAAREAGRPQDEAKICAQLTSTAFYLGDYDQALVYANRCHELSETFEDPALFVRALYLESAVHRATAGKNGEQASYMRAVQVAEEALIVYQMKGIDNSSLQGKVYFNLGAAHADNPEGDLVKAGVAYAKALQCYTAAHATDDLIRTSIRLGKVYLLQKRYDLTEKVINEVRPQIATERLAMHVDYLEAQLKIATNDVEGAIKIAKTGLARAQALGAKEDDLRFIALLQKITPAVCFVACHGGPADHFSTFAEDLVKKGHKVQIYAAGPALKKFQDRHIEMVIPFSLENISEEDVAIEVAKECAEANVVITDVGHAFDVPLQKALVSHASKALRLAYYDNPESYVPGGYSSGAAKVMLAAQGVLFANANLAKAPIYQAPSEEVMLAPERRIGLGYYPISQAEKIAKRRTSDHELIRSQLFSKYALIDQGQKVLVYAGGNNDEYFTKAFPAFLQFLAEASQQADLSNVIVVLQQHPGAKEKNIDTKLVQQWIDQVGRVRVPQFFVSELNSDDAQVVADGMLYYQTSMGPQFVLAGIPTIQVGHNTYEDILVKNNLCSTATDAYGLLNAITHLQQGVKVESDHETIERGLGISSDWADNLEHAIQGFVPLESSVQEEAPPTLPAKSQSKSSIRSYLLAAGAALTVGYFAVRLFKRISAAKA